MSNAGRPTDYKEEHNEQAKKLCLLGATDKDLAEFFEVCEKTINNWKQEYPDFLQSIKEGKQIADAKVAESLYKRATGYIRTDYKFATEGGKITDQVEYEVLVPPDPTSAIFWLKNRRAQDWREKQELDVSAKTEVTLTKEDQGLL